MKRDLLRTLAARMYNARDKANPLFARKESPKKLKVVLLSSLIVVGVIGGGTYLVMAKELYLSAYDIQGLRDLPEDRVRAVSDEYLERRSWNGLKRGHLFSFRTASFTEHLESALPLKVEEVKRAGTTLHVRLTDTLARAEIRRDTGERYLLDGEGIIIRPLHNNEERPDLLHFSMKGPKEVAAEDLVACLAPYLLVWHSELQPHGLIVESGESSDMQCWQGRVGVADQPPALVDLRDDSKERAGAYRDVLENMKERTINRVDLRFGRNIYLN